MTKEKEEEKEIKTEILTFEEQREQNKKALLIEKIQQNLSEEELKIATSENLQRLKSFIKEHPKLLGISMNKARIKLDIAVQRFCNKQRYKILNDTIYLNDIKPIEKEYTELTDKILTTITNRISKYIELQLKDFSLDDKASLLTKIINSLEQFRRET